MGLLIVIITAGLILGNIFGWCHISYFAIFLIFFSPVFFAIFGMGLAYLVGGRTLLKKMLDDLNLG